MIWLCGSEAEAEVMGTALLKYAVTKGEEALVRKHYQLARDAAHEAGKGLDIPLHPKLEGLNLNEAAEPSLSPAEEVEFDEFMRKVYERVEQENK